MVQEEQLQRYQQQLEEINKGLLKMLFFILKHYCTQRGVHLRSRAVVRGH